MGPIMTESFDVEAARHPGVDAFGAGLAPMSEHHINWSSKLTEAQIAVETDPSEENRAAYDELARQMQAARQYEREALAGVPHEQRLGKARPDGSWEWHASVAEHEQDPDVATSRPEMLPEDAVFERPPPGAAHAPTIDGSSTTGG